MSNIPVAPTPAPAAVAAEPAPKAPLPNGGLPDAVRPNHNYDASEFFEKHQVANGKPGAAPAAIAANPTAPEKPANEPATPAAPAPQPPAPVEPPKGSIAAKLAARKKPDAAPAPAAPAAADGQPSDNPLDKHQLDPKYSQPAHESFSKLKTFAQGLQDQLSAARENERQLKAQLDAAKSGVVPSDTAELEKLRAENRALSDKLAVTDLREHPEFQSKVLQPQEAALAEASAIFEANAKTVDVASMLKLPKPAFLKAIGEASKELSVAEQVEVSTHLRNAWELRQKADTMLGKARETYGALRNQSTETQKRVFDQTWERVAAPITEHLVTLEVPDDATPQQRQEIESHNAAINGLRGAAERVAFGSSKTEDIAANSIKAAAYDLHVGRVLPKILGEYDALLKLNAQLADQIKAIKGRNPNIGGTAPGAGGGGPADPQDPRNMDHRAAADHFYSPPR